MPLVVRFRGNVGAMLELSDGEIGRLCEWSYHPELRGLFTWAYGCPFYWFCPGKGFKFLKDAPTALEVGELMRGRWRPTSGVQLLLPFDGAGEVVLDGWWRFGVRW